MKAKLTASLVTETAKQTLVELRNEYDLTEKQLVDLVLKQALRRKSELTKLVESFHSNLENEKASRKSQRLAEYKQKAAMKRKEKSAEKLKAKLAKLEGTAE
jgi:replication initiation and membrane attachment protein DnaB